MAKKRFYVYTLAEPNDLVFYVGKVQGKRVHAHEKEAQTDCSCPKSGSYASSVNDVKHVATRVV